MAELNPFSEPSSLVQRVAESLLARKQTLALAESCTGGRVSALLATYPGISSSYMGSVVAYANHVKAHLLDVPDHLFSTVGAVSAPVAIAMANGASRRLKADWGVSLTGIAGPGGGSPAKPVGTVFFGISGPGIEHAESKLFSGSRTEIQQAAADHALGLLLRHLE